MEEKLVPKVLIVDADKCTGCNVCELACSMAKHGEYNPQKSLIRVMKNREMSVDIVTVDVRCDFCNQCVEWCLARAIEFVTLPEAAVIRKQNRIGKFPAPCIRSGQREGSFPGGNPFLRRQVYERLDGNHPESGLD